MKKLLFWVLLFASVPAFAFELEINDISETEGFYVEYRDSQINIKNNTGADAFNVYVLLYRQDDPSVTFNVEDNKQYGGRLIPVIPEGFTFNIKNVSLYNSSVTYKYKAKVYYLTEYK